jgi:prepilin-type N-terminal cleavage/methylation domain-containing protein
MVTRHGPGLRSPRRGAFTLVEVLVVIAIIVLLVSLTVGATIYYMSTAQETHAQTTLKKLDTGLLQQWKAVIDTAQDEWRAATTASLQGNSRSAVIAAAGGDATKAQQLWILLRLQQEFPTTYKEAQNPTTISGITVPAKAAYVKALPNNAGSAANLATGPEESSACLLVALSVGRRGMVFNVEDAVGVSAIRTLTIPASNGTAQVRVLSDIYQTPLGFTRGSNGLSPEITSAGKDQAWNTGDDLSSVRLRATGQRGD